MLHPSARARFITTSARAFLKDNLLLVVNHRILMCRVVDMKLFLFYIVITIVFQGGGCIVDLLRSGERRFLNRYSLLQ